MKVSKRLLPLLLSLIGYLGLASVAGATTDQYWYVQGANPNGTWPGCTQGLQFDCFSLQTPPYGTNRWWSDGGNFPVVNDTSQVGFITPPSQTAPNTEAGGDCTGDQGRFTGPPVPCFGGYTPAGVHGYQKDPWGWPSASYTWGTYCTDYSNESTAAQDLHAAQDCIPVSSLGEWGLQTGSRTGDTCFCGVHLTPSFTGSQSWDESGTNYSEQDYPWRYTADSVLHIGFTSSFNATGIWWVGYQCAFLTDATSSTPTAIVEFCDAVWSSGSTSGGNNGYGNSVSCNNGGIPQVLVTFDGTPGDNGRYASSGVGSSSFTHDQTASHYFEMTISGNQFSQALQDLSAAGCNTDVNITHYFLDGLEYGIEGGTGSTDGAALLENGAFAYTRYP